MRRRAAFRYYLALGPGRTLSAVANGVENYGDINLIAKWASMYGWKKKAEARDKRLIESIQKHYEEQQKEVYDLMVGGLDNSLQGVFRRDEQGRIVSALKIKSWKDLAECVKLRDYLLGNTGRNPNDLSTEPGGIHLAIVNMLQMAKAEGGVDPYLGPRRDDAKRGAGSQEDEGILDGQISEDADALQDSDQRPEDRNVQVQRGSGEDGQGNI